MNIHVACKMGHKRMCPDSDKKKKKTSPKRHTDEGKKDRGDSAHAKKRIGLFTAEEMKACIDEIKEVEQKVKDEGKKPVAVSLEIKEVEQKAKDEGKKPVVDLRTLSGSGEGNFLPATVFASAFAFLVSSDEELSL